MKQTTSLAARNYYLLTWLWRDASGRYPQKLVPTRNWSFAFSQEIGLKLKKKKSSTINDLKSPFWVSSYLNQQLIVSNLQNQSVTDRQTDRQDDYYNPLAHACRGLIMLLSNFYPAKCFVVVVVVVVCLFSMDSKSCVCFYKCWRDGLLKLTSSLPDKNWIIWEILSQQALTTWMHITGDISI